MRISVELVPREPSLLKAELALLRDRFAEVNTINIPDLLSMNLRSWEGCVLARQIYRQAIPHIRAIDFSLRETLHFVDVLEANGIDEILVVTGDMPNGLAKTIYPTTSVELIKKIKTEHPKLRVYAAVDPYRGSFRSEMEYIKRKIDAGADGFFTQPFFDLRLMEMYAEMLAGFELFWGISPVTTIRSQHYWEIKNNVIFPRELQLDLEWNAEFARRAINFARANRNNVYIMPVKIALETYMSMIFWENADYNPQGGMRNEQFPSA